MRTSCRRGRGALMAEAAAMQTWQWTAVMAATATMRALSPRKTFQATSQRSATPTHSAAARTAAAALMAGCRTGTRAVRGRTRWTWRSMSWTSCCKASTTLKGRPSCSYSPRWCTRWAPCRCARCTRQFKRRRCGSFRNGVERATHARRSAPVAAAVAPPMARPLASKATAAAVQAHQWQARGLPPLAAQRCLSCCRTPAALRSHRCSSSCCPRPRTTSPRRTSRHVPRCCTSNSRRRARATPPW
mmetsp:Transcript_42106/g.126011  ORF Transcript_42106/g.126011 Transcript_42106/m.126011 type:complete len:245 (+) Transcript_42106:661-1395(+)